MTSEQIEAIQDIDQLALQVAKQHQIPDDPLEKAKDPSDVGDAASACRLLVGNALPRLFTDESWSLAAFLYDTVAKSFISIKGIDYWNLLDTTFDTEINELLSATEQLHAVLCRKLSDETPSRQFLQAMRSGGAKALQKAAQVSETEGTRDLENKVTKTQEALSAHGFEVSIAWVPALKPSGVVWPRLDVWIGLHLTSLFDFIEHAERIVDLIEESFEPTRQVIVVPIREGRLIGPLAMHGRRIQGFVLPADRASQGWPSLLDFDWADLSLHRKLEQLVDGALRHSCLEGLSEQRPLVGEEITAIQEAQEDVAAADRELSEAVAEDPSGFLGDVLGPIAQLLNEGDFAARMARQLRGEDDETQALLAMVRLALMEWDLDPKSAPHLLEEFLKGLPESDAP